MTTTAGAATSQEQRTPGARVLVVVHEDQAGLGRLEPVLRERLGADAIDERRPDRGDPLPPDTAGHDGMMVLGGSMAAWEDEDAGWLPATRALMLDAIARGVPTLGICLGAQMLALAAGGTVERGPAGLEVGVVPVELLPEASDDPLLAPVAAAFDGAAEVPQWHRDAITALPPDAVRLATGTTYANQAFRVGCAWGLQYHPEVTRADWEAWNSGGAGSIRETGLEPADIDRQAIEREDHLARSADLHAAAFADLVAARVAARTR